MSKLFETTTIRNMTLANRFIRSATYEGLAGDDGSCTRKLIDMMTQLARVEVGLIITGLANVSRDGIVAPRQMGAYSDQLLPGLIRMTNAVHAEGGKIAMQIVHGGAEAPPSLTGTEAMGPSARGNEMIPSCRGMTREDIDRVVQDFSAATIRAQKAGFDGVQIHAAHGWLLSQFLSPYFNKRRDDYGGNVKNRARILLEVLESARNGAGEDFPLLIKINTEDFLDRGFSVDDMLKVATWLEASGIDAVEFSGGTRYSGSFFWSRKGSLESEEQEVYYRDTAKRYKQEIDVPLILTGGIRSYRVAERLINEGIADYIGVCRPLIREPNLFKRWKSGDTRKASCVSCNLCRGPLGEGKGLYCVIEEQSHNKET
jgi:2,4-dienoyl-CoA reductase-like NADH-dependent reductase (Old Yellow Enzyme family)